MIDIALMGLEKLSNLITGFLHGNIWITGSVYGTVGTVFLFHWLIFMLAYFFKFLSNKRG